ncbi:MAG: hypothetical protein WAL66_11490 [Nitrososphaeraceae archaeon]
MFSSFIVRNTNVHRGSKIVTGLKNNRSAANGSTDHKSNQNEPIKQNVSPTPKITVIDIEREDRLSKVISM